MATETAVDASKAQGMRRCYCVDAFLCGLSSMAPIVSRHYVGTVGLSNTEHSHART
jgi:hypothetical protein